MTLSQAQQNGGAQALTTSSVLTVNSPRVISCYNTSTIDVTLPSAANCRDNERGGPWFYIARRSTGSVVIKNSAGSTLVTLSANQVAVIVLRSDFRVHRVRTLNTARALVTSARAAVTNAPVTVVPKDVSCFSGSLCELADAEGSLPLDGDDGRDDVTVPMVQDIIRFAKNEGREVIRASDIVMPSVVTVEVDMTAFVKDASSIFGSVDLSQAFYRLFEKPIALTYQATALNAVSRHPLHMRWVTGGGGSVWTHGSGAADLQVTRARWAKDITYETADGTFTASIVFVAEFKKSGNIMHRTEGAWGTIFSVYIFTDELGSYTDGSNIQPPGSKGDITFTRQDPLVSGIAFGQPNDEFFKVFGHPQLVAAAHSPTSYHAAADSLYVPVIKRRQDAFGLPLENDEYCYRRKAQSPFASVDNCNDEAPALTGEARNICAFGWSELGGTNNACYTFGGDMDPRSRLLEFLVWENQRAEGVTYLQPIKPGWSADCGKLDIVGGSAGSLGVCTDDQWGLPDENGERKWSGATVSPCDGHPAEPYEGVGGSHKCFNNGNTVNTSVPNCCVSVLSATASTANVVVEQRNRFGDFNGFECEPLESECRQVRTMHASNSLQVEDYILGSSAAGTVQQERIMSWVRYLRSPNAQPRDGSHTPASAEYSTAIGAFNRSSLTVTSAVSPTTSPESALVYDPPSATYAKPNTTCTPFTSTLSTGDYDVEARIDAAGKHVIGGRFSGTSSSATCVAAEIVPTGGSNATLNIVRWTAGTRVVLKTLNITNYAQPSTWKFALWGAEYKLTCGELNVSLTAYDCTSSSYTGLPFIGGPVNASFSSYIVTDKNPYVVSIDGAMGARSVSMFWPCELQPSQDGSCVASSDPGCGSCCEPARCNCENVSCLLYYYEGASWANGSRDILVADCRNEDDPEGRRFGTNGENPTAHGAPLPVCNCGGAWCPPITKYCGECPDPFRALGIALPQGCYNKEADPKLIPKHCRGIDRFYYVTTVCY